jgi:hypothetical protein
MKLVSLKKGQVHTQHDGTKFTAPHTGLFVDDTEESVTWETGVTITLPTTRRIDPLAFDIRRVSEEPVTVNGRMYQEHLRHSAEGNWGSHTPEHESPPEAPLYGIPPLHWPTWREAAASSTLSMENLREAAHRAFYQPMPELRQYQEEINRISNEILRSQLLFGQANVRLNSDGTGEVLNPFEGENNED